MQKKRYEGMKKKVNIKGKLIQSWAYYILICGFLSIVNYLTKPNDWWVLWVIFGWGFVQLLYTANYFIKEKYSK